MAECDYDKLAMALDLSDIDPVEFVFWCPDCLEPREICRCHESEQRGEGEE